MQDSVLDLLGSALIPILGTDVAAGTAGNIHLALVGIAALGADPNQLAVILLDTDFAVIAAALAVVRLGVQLRIHDVVIDILHQLQNRIDVLLHIGYFHVADGATGAQVLELGLKGQLGESINFLRNMDMVGIGDVILVRDAGDDAEAKPFALQVMQHMNDACKGWKAEHNMDFSLYGTPLESTTYKFAKCLQHRFGVVEGINDKGYITNSYHVHVTEEINAFDKLKFEAQFQHLSPGGAISYVEVPDMQNNLEAVLQVMKFIYDNIIYAELNTKSDYCQVCGWDGEIQIEEVDGKLIWKCPKCGNTDQDKMNVARRTCGYIGTQFWNQGRTQEIRDRVLHL